jgi:hypothetical protein
LEFSANDDIRQALTLFFSVYPFTAAVHQEIIAQSLDEIIFDLLDPEDGNGLSVSHIAMQLTNWLDPKQLTKGSESADDCYQHRTKFAIAVCRGSCARSVSQIKAVFSIISQIPLTIDECVTKELESIIDDLLEVGLGLLDI